MLQHFLKGKRRISTKKIPSPLSKFLLFILKNKIGKKKSVSKLLVPIVPPKNVRHKYSMKAENVTFSTFMIYLDNKSGTNDVN